MKRPLAALLALGFSIPAFAASAASAAPAKAAAAAAWTADAVNAAAPKPIKGAGSGPHVLRAQILLDRARFSPGELDGAAGANMRRAVAGFQRKIGLEETGAVDAATWEALAADTAPALVEYVITDADAAGPFVPVPKEMAAKAALPALGYASAEEALAEKFHASPALLRRLNPGADFAGAGATIVVPNVLDIAPLPKAGRIVVDKSERTLTLYDTAGAVIAQYPASMGSAHDPLPLGEWKVKGIARNPVFHYNPKLFWDASPADRKTRIPAGPNNPVGVAWIDLSKDHYGIHGTPEPSGIGKTQSHGCIRLTNWDVAALLTSVAAGTAVSLEE